MPRDDLDVAPELRRYLSACVFAEMSAPIHYRRNDFLISWAIRMSDKVAQPSLRRCLVGIGTSCRIGLWESGMRSNVPERGNLARVDNEPKALAFLD